MTIYIVMRRGEGRVGKLWDDLDRIRNHPLVPRNIPIYGYVYDVTTGLLNEVAASRRGGGNRRWRARP